MTKFHKKNRKNFKQFRVATRLKIFFSGFPNFFSVFKSTHF